MSKYRALIVDFDGTLVDENFYLTSRVKDAVVNLVRKGIIFSIATGRPYLGMVKNICHKLKLVFPQIVNGGAKIIDPKNEKVLWAEYLAQKSVRDLVDYFLKNNFDFAIEADKFVFTKQGVNTSNSYGLHIPFRSLDELDTSKVSKIVLFDISSIADPQKLEEDLGEKYKDLHFVRSGRQGSPLVLDITSIKATKHLAVLELSKILKIDPKDMIGVGDGYNDYPLLSVCGYKVAMENAPEQLKGIADLIVPDVYHDGLVTLIDSIIDIQ